MTNNLSSKNRKQKYSSNLSNKNKGFPLFHDFEGMRYQLDATFRNKSKASSFAKQVHKRGNYSRVLERQRGNKMYHCVYSRAGRKTEENKAKFEEKMRRKMEREKLRTVRTKERVKRTEITAKDIQNNYY